MKWAFSIRPKIKAAFILAVVFFLVLAKNVIDNNNVDKLGTSFSSVYEDRLLVESYIYKISGHLYQKKIMLDKNEADFFKIKSQINAHNTGINALLVDYEKTKLTEDETVLFAELKKNITQIMLLEDYFIHIINTGNKEEISRTKSLMDIKFNFASANLNQLSVIQISEAKILNDKSKKIISNSSILTHFELALLIGFGLLIQFLLLASNSSFSKNAPQHHSLN